MIDRLIGSKEYVDYWTNKWADLLQVNRKFLDLEGAVAFRNWIREQVAENTPYDQFVRSILTASGSNRENPAASYSRSSASRPPTMENTTQLFLAVRFNCNKCHDHPFERWTQDQYYQTAAYLRAGRPEGRPGQRRQADRRHGRRRRPSRCSRSCPTTPDGEIKHDRTGQVTPPKFPFPRRLHGRRRRPRRREQLAAWLTSRRQSVLRPELCQPALGLPVRRRHHRADRRHPRRQPGHAIPSCSTT